MGLGLGSGSRVVIVAERAPWLIWTMLAVSRIGAVFVVLDGAYPEKRIETLAGIAMPDAILGSASAAIWGLAADVAIARNVDLVDADAEYPEPTLSSLPAMIAEDQPAYFLFTSGSTGLPKCVACSHIPLSHFVKWQTESFGLIPTDRFTMLSGLSHDPLMRDIFTPLSIGAVLLIPEQDDIYGPGRLLAWFKKVQPSVAHMTPAMSQLLTAGRTTAGALGDLRLVFMGGDSLRPPVIRDLRVLAPNAEVINFYGSTETPQAAGFYRWRDDEDFKTVPVGTGSDGFQLVVMDPAHRPLGFGEEGEIARRPS